MPAQLMQLAEDNNIIIDYVDFQHTHIDAMYINLPECQPVILLSKKTCNNRRHLRSVLAHEIGHYYTTVKSTVPVFGEIEQTYLSYHDRTEMSREEYHAWRWAANYLIPTNVLETVYSEDFCEPWQLADFFNVDENVVEIKLDILKRSDTKFNN
jgi:Zn-dependent peptidase ImmA (M78 family)